MAPVPCLRHDTPAILSTPSDFRLQLLAAVDELDARIEIQAAAAATAMDTSMAASLGCSIDKKRIHEVVAELLNDEMSLARQWLNNQLEEVY